MHLVAELRWCYSVGSEREFPRSLQQPGFRILVSASLQEIQRLLYTHTDEQDVGQDTRWELHEEVWSCSCALYTSSSLTARGYNKSQRNLQGDVAWESSQRRIVYYGIHACRRAEQVSVIWRKADISGIAYYDGIFLWALHCMSWGFERNVPKEMHYSNNL